MWQQILMSSLVFGLAVLGMSLGVIFTGKRLAGSCGSATKELMKAGVANACDFCEKPEEDKKKCKKRGPLLPEEFRG